MKTTVSSKILIRKPSNIALAIVAMALCLNIHPANAGNKPIREPTSQVSDLPYGSPIPGRPGFVNSPHAAKHQLVDVKGMPGGMEVKCPYTGKLFRVPVAMSSRAPRMAEVDPSTGKPRNSVSPPIPNRKEPEKSAFDLPYGCPSPVRAGLVNSPYAAKHQLLDVTGLPIGMAVKCPYTGKLFRVPSQY